MGKKKRKADEAERTVWVKMQLPEADNRLLRGVALLLGLTPSELVSQLIDEHLRPEYER